MPRYGTYCHDGRVGCLLPLYHGLCGKGMLSSLQPDNFNVVRKKSWTKGGMLAPAVRRYAVTRKRYFEAWANAQLDNNLHNLALVKGVNSNINSWLKKCQLELQDWTLASRNVNWTAHRLKCTSLKLTFLYSNWNTLWSVDPRSVIHCIQHCSWSVSHQIFIQSWVGFWVGSCGHRLRRIKTNISDYIVSSS
jgi:hypothetical protein